MSSTPRIEARDHLAMMGLLQALGEVGTPMTADKRRAAIELFAATLKLLYPEAAEDTEQTRSKTA